MAQLKKKLRPLHSYLEQLPSNSLLKPILAKATVLKNLERKIHQHLPEHIAKHCQLANYSRGKLTLKTHNATWATSLRCQAPLLYECLKYYSEFSELKKISVINRPKYTPSDPSPLENQKTPISSAVRKRLLETAKRIHHPKLKKALLRLGDR